MAQVKETYNGRTRHALVATWITVTNDGRNHLELRWVPSHESFDDFVASMPAAA